MSNPIKIDGDEAIRRFLRGNLLKAIADGALGVAAEVQDRTAAYPPAPPRREGKGYYVRGVGGFSASGKQTSQSETMNRRWDIQSVPFGANLRNLASYSGKVKGRNQRKRFAEIGWTKTFEDAQAVIRDGTAEQILIDAISAELRKGQTQ